MLISYINVKGLNGYIDREFELPQSNVSIIYGDNGSGKTSIFSSVYHLINSDGKSGHRTYLSNISFDKIEIEFGDKCKIIAKRNDSTSLGPYNLEFFEKDKMISKVSIQADFDKDENRFVVRGKGSNKIDEFYRIVSNKCPDIVFMPDDRAYLKGKSIPTGFNYKYSIGKMYESIKNFENRMISSDAISIREMQNFQLETLIEIAGNSINYAIKNALMSNSSQTDNVYLSVIKNISEGQSGLRFIDIMERLERVKNRTESNLEFRSFFQINIDEIKKSYDSSNKSQKAYITKVMIPYVESLENKLKSLEKALEILNLLTSEFQKYFSDKEIGYNFNDGFILYKKIDSTPLDFKNLSSGERQILFILFSIVSIGDKKSIMLIDEPEISLNVKWQRELPDTILKFCEKQNLQVIMASHSLEMIGQMMDGTVKI